MSLVPLTCPPCGRPVAIGLGDTARCLACDCEVAIPEPYLRLRAAARLDDDARARAEVISAELTRPPAPFMRFWMTAGNVAVLVAVVLLVVWLLVALVMCIGTFASGGPIGAFIMLLIGFVLGIPLLYDETLHALAEPLHADYADVWGGAIAFGLLGLSFWIITVLPMVLAAHAESFEAVRTALRTALAAKPTEMPGGAADCRTCGAPLDIVADQLHARCVYCGADNLVHLGDARLASVAADTQAACTDLESAIAEEAEATRRGRKRVASQLATWLAAVPVCILLGWAVAAINDGDVTFWHRAVASTPMLPRTAENPVLARGEATVFDVHKTFDGCDDSDCWADYFVALEHGDALRISAEGGELRIDAIAQRFVGPWYDPTYQWQAMDLDALAPYSGWYRVRLATPKDDGVDPIVTWEVER